MAWHVVASSYFDFDRIARESAADRLPVHLLPHLAERLGARLHQPETGPPPSMVDRVAARLYGQPKHWELARRVLPELRPGDAVYAAGCDGGLPLALLCAARRRQVAFAMTFTNLDRRRARAIGWLLVLVGVRLLVSVATERQADQVRRAFGRRTIGIHVNSAQTDTWFFRPPEARPANDPPLVAGSGVEQRDYRSLAEALGPADVAIDICYASPNQTARTPHSRPDVVPDNMELRHMEFHELRDLYQRADVVVVPLCDNRFSAGLTALLEAIACEAPVVATSSPGVIDDLESEGLIVGVPMGDVEAIRAAVDGVIARPEQARSRAVKARRVLLERYSATSYLAGLERTLHELVAPVGNDGGPGSPSSTT